MPHAPAGVVAEWNEARSHVALSWAAPPMTSVSNYTFFWCDRLEITRHTCKVRIPLQYFDQHRVYIIDQVEYGVHDRLHVYPLCGIFYFPGIDTR